MGIEDFWPASTGGRPLGYTPAEVDLALRCLARVGGSSTRAIELYRQTEVRAQENAIVDGVARDPMTVPSAKTLRTWREGRFHGRYLEILSELGPEIEDQIAGHNLELALGQHRVEAQAMKVIESKLNSTDAVSASTILRNVSQAKAANIQHAQALRGTSEGHAQARSLEEVARAISRLPGVTVDGLVEDADVVPDAPALPAP
jgi:hypothetical protein